MFGKNHIQMYKYTYFLITEFESYWIEEGQIKKLEQEKGKFFMYIKDLFKQISPLYLISNLNTL